MGALHVTVQHNAIITLYCIQYTNAPNSMGMYVAKLFDHELILINMSIGQSVEECLTSQKLFIQGNIGKIINAGTVPLPSKLRNVLL